MTVFIDTNIAFIEESDFDFEHANKNFLHRNEYDRLNGDTQFNCLNKSGTYEISLFIGLDTTFSNNKLLNSSFYDQDVTLGKNLTPFIEKESYKGNKIGIVTNPKKFVRTYGIDNQSLAFENFMNMPFEDLDGTSSVSEYFSNAESINYVRYFSDYATDKLNGSISIFGVVDDLIGRNLTLYKIKGIKGDIISGGTDARNRQIIITDKTNVQGNSTPDNIEPFLDQLNDTNNSNDMAKITVGYEYVTQNINNRNVLVLKNDSQSSSVITVNTSSQYYLSDDNHNMLPFNDTRLDELIVENNLRQQNSDYNRTDNYASAGSDNNNINGGLPESIAFLGEIN